MLLWMMATLWDFGLDFMYVPLLCDSTSAISVANNHVLHSKTKHIEVRFHFLKDHYEKGDIDLCHVDTHRQLADILTKSLNPSTFTHLRGELGVCCHGTSQGIRPTYRCPRPKDLRQSCRCAQWLGRSYYLYLHHIAQERLTHHADITYHRSKQKRLQ
jgi:hypothetical protein